jgi:hypothetical protein
VNPFEQLVSPEALAEAVASSTELRQLPAHFYRPLDSDHGRWKKAMDANAAAAPRTPPVPRPAITSERMAERHPAWGAAPVRGMGLQR